jgi:Glycerophosphoryl diester phosphodiesterase family
MLLRLLPIALFMLPVFGFCQKPLSNAHAHNDYEHPRPLLDALACGFTEVEADVYLIDGDLYVAHDRPQYKDSTRTLRNLYLRPLQDRISAHQGRIYPGYAGHFYLMIDFKTAADSTYPVLRAQLQEFSTILSAVRDTVDEGHKPVKIFISGNRPSVANLQRDSVQWAALDGRPDELGKGVPVSLMPVVSTHYARVLQWRGTGDIDPKDRQRLLSFVQQAHAEGKKVRLWGAPDTPACWRLLLSAGVDLINTDKLREFAEFMKG